MVRNEEATATQLVNGLTFIGASVECRREAVPFLCQLLFGVCDGSGISIHPTSSQCEVISDMICRQEWILIKQLGMELPDCAMFLPEASSCPALNNSHSQNGTVLGTGTVSCDKENYYIYIYIYISNLGNETPLAPMKSVLGLIYKLSTMCPDTTETRTSCSSNSSQ